VKCEHECRLKAAPAPARGSQAEALKLPARLEDLNVWERELVKEIKKGSRT
jgi:hypothetical protein